MAQVTSFVAVLPAIIPDLARRCITSMAPELRSQLLLVDNTGTGEIADEHAASVWFTARPPCNTGVTEPWNQGIAFAECEEVEWLYLISQSMTFGAAGGMDLIDACAGEKHITHSQYGWHALMLHRRVWQKVGRFDPVFPDYGAETDLLYRMGLAGLPSPRENGRTFTQVVIDAECEPDAACLRAGVVEVEYSDHLDAYRKKWNGDQGDERWARPYNDETLDWTFTGTYDGYDGADA